MSRLKHRTAFALVSLVLGLLVAPAVARDAGGTITRHQPMAHGVAAATPATAPRRLEDLLGGIPAFALELNVNTFAQQYATFDVTSPGTSTRIGAVPINQVASGTFIDNDFRHHYLLSKLNKLVVVDTSDGTSTVVGDSAPVLEYEFWTGVRWDPETHNVYATTCTNNGTGCFLYTIDPHTGDATRIAEVGNPGEGWFPMEIAIDSKGRLFMINIGASSGYKNWLTRIDKQTGAVTPIGDTGINPMYIQGLDFDRRDDTLYWTAMGNLSPTGGPQGQLYTVDTETGAPSFLGVLPNGGSEIWAFAIATAAPDDDTLFADGFELP